MSNFVSIEGPVESVDGKLMLRIPLKAGGDTLASYARGIGEIRGDELIVEIRVWLAQKLDVGAGSLVVVDNMEGKFRITRSEKNDLL